MDVTAHALNGRFLFICNLYIIPMSRSRAERRHNTHVKTSARKAKAIRGEVGQFPAHGYCGGKISPNGEARSCPLCESSKPYERGYRQMFLNARLESFILSHEE